MRFQQGPRFAVGLLASGRSRFHPGNLHFNSAIVGVVVLANAVRKVDAAALVKAQFRSAEGHIPTHGANRAKAYAMGGRRIRALREIQPDVAFFHYAEWRHQTCIAGRKDRFGIAVPQRLKLAQPTSQYRRDAIKR